MKALGIDDSIRSQDIFIQQVQHKENQKREDEWDQKVESELIEQVEWKLKRIQQENHYKEQLY